MKTRLAPYAPFCGAPRITAAEVFGASADKPFLWRIPVLGQRPVTVTVSGLPDCLSLDGQIVRGTAPAAGEYPVRVRAENALGTDEKTVLLKIAPDGMLQTPLLGFTTWNAYMDAVTDEDIRRTADDLVRLGLAEYGYSYVNLDSSWQDSYGGEFDAIQPCDRFPDMKGMYAHLHSLGLKGGIYSTPFLRAWGCPPDREWIPGCTRGEADIRFSEVNTGIGLERCEAQNVRQWTEWGVDYLKYDWRPTDTVNADLMKKELLKSPREIAFCVTVLASEVYWRYWAANCCSFRNNNDTYDIWDNVVQRMDTVDRWAGKTAPGHFYDLDMLSYGPMVMNDGKCRFTPEEALSHVTLHAFFPSPVQLSMQLHEASEFELALAGNEEVIAVNQDVLCDYPEKLDAPAGCRAWTRKMQNGESVIAVFNLADETRRITLPLRSPSRIRDLWAKENLGIAPKLTVTLDAHEAGLYRIRRC